MSRCADESFSCVASAATREFFSVSLLKARFGDKLSPQSEDLQAFCPAVWQPMLVLDRSWAQLRLEFAACQE